MAVVGMNGLDSNLGPSEQVYETSHQLAYRRNPMRRTRRCPNRTIHPAPGRYATI